MTEDQARKSTECPKCKKDKSIGLVVCWDCFKYIDKPLKSFTGEFNEWLNI